MILPLHPERGAQTFCGEQEAIIPRGKNLGGLDPDALMTVR
jgi:hypothetical protein